MLRLKNSIFICAILIPALSALPANTHAKTILPTQFHKQEHPLSCEIATLKMALSTHGLHIAESELLSRLAFDPTPKQKGVWGDPNQGFVGNIDGRMLISGYGVYWDPIAKLAANYAHTELIEHGSATDLTRHITAGNPVIIWGYYGSGKVYSWNTPQGKQIKAVDAEHTRIVYGFEGTLEAPTHFYVMDPIFGHATWTAQDLMNNWAGLNHMGLAVTQPRWVRMRGDHKVWELNSNRTRRWVTNWPALHARGGRPEMVVNIDENEINKYSIISPIT
jgi:uncharacterized protein YvpB